MQSQDKNGGVQLSSRYQQYMFAKRHFRGTPRPEVFPLEGANGKDIVQINQPRHSNDRVYGIDGVSPTLNTMQGGNRQPFIAKTIRVGGQKSGYGTKQNWDSYLLDGKIRRLTPKECERLQGFPDDWTLHGIDRNTKLAKALGYPEQLAISDTQRYKVLGNAVTVSVIQAIMEKILYANQTN